MMRTLMETIANRHILFAVSGRGFKAQYRAMSLGFLWALLNPLIMVTVLSTVLAAFLAPANEFRPSLVVIGLVPFNMISYCFNGCVGSITGNASLVRRVIFPRQILPLAVIATQLVHFAIQSTLIIGVLAIFGAPNGPWSINLLWLPLIVLVHIGLVCGAGMLFAALHTRYRDVKYMVASLLTVLFWASPVLYDAHATFDKVEGGWRAIHYAYFLNPVAGVLDAYRQVLYWGHAPDLYVSLMAISVVLVLGFVGVKVFWRLEGEFAENCR